MAKCEYCNEDMLKSKGCTVDELILNDGKSYKRIKVGDKYDFYETEDEEADIICHDCNARRGHYHHANCDCEICPKCHQQLISCDC